MKTALALGTFDGLHKGHREVLRLPERLQKNCGYLPAAAESAYNGQTAGANAAAG